VNLVPTGDGWGTSSPPDASAGSSLANFANVPICPNQWATNAVDGNSYSLEVTLKDRGGRTLSKSINVTPQCADGDVNCTCTCAAGYVLGTPCAFPGTITGGD
jgi:hypothetical protein